MLTFAFILCTLFFFFPLGTSCVLQFPFNNELAFFLVVTSYEYHCMFTFVYILPLTLGSFAFQFTFFYDRCIFFNL